MELEEGAEYDVFVCNFGSCSSFFIQVIDPHDQWNNLMNALATIDEANLKPMEEIKVRKLCLVESDGELQRAKIIRHSKRSTMCFCLDSAEIVYFHNEPESVFEITERILNIMPFQAVNCRLAAVKAPIDAVVTGLIYRKIIKRLCQQRVRIIKRIYQNPDLELWGLKNINSYDVQLFSKDDGKVVNDLVVDYQLADRD